MARPIEAQETFVDLRFPAKGIDLSQGFGMQQPGTTPAGLNVRAYEPSTGRARGGSRPGLAKYTNAIVQAGTIQELATVVGVGYTAPGSVPRQVTSLYLAGSSSAFACTFTQPTTTGNGILVLITSHGGSSPTSVRDTAGNTYTLGSSATKASDGIGGSGRSENVSVWHCLSATGAATLTVTATYAVATEGGMIALEVPGLLALDAATAATGTGTPAAPGTVTTAQASEFAVFAVLGAAAGGSNTISPPVGWTDLTGSVSQFPTDFGYQITGAAGAAVNPSMTVPAGGWACCLAVYKLSLSGSQPSQSARVVTLVAVDNGVVYATGPSGLSWAVAANTTGKTLATSGVVRSAANNQKLWFADGVHYLYYDPARNAVLDWMASAGTLPADTGGNTPRLICTWRGRTVVSGLLLDGQNWFMSAVGDPTNWNYFPLPITPTQAVAGNNSSLGLVGDVVTSLVPYSDDVLIFGGDHTIYACQGDPMAGGSLNLVSDTIGFAWGNPWCKGPDGTMYFFSNKMGVYSMVPGQAPVRMSQQVEQLLSGLDTGANIIRLQWDDLYQGFHAWITPATTGTTTHLFWEQRTGAWWQDSFASTNFDPLCCVTFDGNTTSDRRSLIGSRDGYVRTMTPSASTDDGQPIASSVILGPLLTKDMDDVLLKDLQAILGVSSGSVAYAVHVGPSAEAALAAAPVAAGVWSAGRNLDTYVRRAGHAVYVKITSGSAWSMEAIRARVAGRNKVRRRGY